MGFKGFGEFAGDPNHVDVVGIRGKSDFAWKLSELRVVMRF